MQKSIKEAVRAIDEQKWLDDVGEPLQKLITSAYESGGEQGKKIKNLVHGTWLEHPLHPVITDLPLGAWTTAFFFDLFGRSGGGKMAAGADAAVALGLVGAAGSAISGLTDWQHTDGRTRRVGLMHGLLNIGATVCYLVSFFLRVAGARGSGRRVSILGYAVATAAAYLGGELVYGDRIGVSRAEPPRVKPGFSAVLAETELPDSKPTQVDLEGTKLLLVRRGQKVFAIGDVCSHLGCWLSKGKLQPDNSMVCPCHQSRFSLEDGRVLDGPATFPEPQYEARIRQGQVEVRAVEG